MGEWLTVLLLVPLALLSETRVRSKVEALLAVSVRRCSVTWSGLLDWSGSVNVGPDGRLLTPGVGVVPLENGGMLLFPSLTGWLVCSPWGVGLEGRVARSVRLTGRGPPTDVGF